MSSLNEKLHNERRSYEKDVLEIANTPVNPFLLFDTWYKEAASLKSFEANAMIVSTVNNNMQPSSRVVLLKAYSEKGLQFFTNYNSHKGQDLLQNNKVSILFFYEAMERQIRIEGTTVQLSDAENDEYFYSRPIDSQYGAMASMQSSIIKSKEELYTDLEEIKQEYSKPIRPKNWGGYNIIPHYFEFWQGRPNRMHDRVTYNLNKDKWTKNILSP